MSTSINAAKMIKTRLRVVSYNILSEGLCNERQYPFNDPLVVREEYRLPVIKNKLQTEMKKNGIICLQEVTQKFSGDLHRLCSNNDYYMITGLYGNHFNGNMGVALAFPIKKYELVESALITVGETKKIPKDPEISVIWKYIYKISSVFVTPDKPFWKQVREKKNMLIAVKLKDKETNEEFVVATYHMPCNFKNPPFMVAHAALSIQAVEKFSKSGSVPFIFAGDYNFMPGSSMYQLYANGNLPIDNKELPPPIEGDKWSLSLLKPYRSAYAAFNKSEPYYTNIAKSAHGGSEVFSGCLDYIFLSEHWTVDGVEQLKVCKPDELSSHIQPTKTEPSDHLLIAADLSISK